MNMTFIRNTKYQGRINKEEGFYPAPKGEQDLKQLINKWNSEITKFQLLNKLVKPTDTVKTKNEIAQNLKLLSKDHENFRFSNGFKSIESVVGQEKIDLLLREKETQDTLVRTYRERTPTYTEKKKVMQIEYERKMKDTQHLIEKVSKTRKEIKMKHRSMIEENKRLAEIKSKKEEEQNAKEEAEREKLRQQKLKEIEDK